MMRFLEPAISFMIAKNSLKTRACGASFGCASHRCASFIFLLKLIGWMGSYSSWDSLTLLTRIIMASSISSIRAHAADAVPHEPCRLVRDLERAVELMGADALLAAAHQEEGQKPLVERNVALLEHSANRDSELAAAVIAEVQPLAVAFLGALDFGDVLGRCGAVGADRTERPTQLLKVGARRVLVIEDRICQIGHGFISVAMKVIHRRTFVKYIMRPLRHTVHRILHHDVAIMPQIAY